MIDNGTELYNHIPFHLNINLVHVHLVNFQKLHNKMHIEIK